MPRKAAARQARFLDRPAILLGRGAGAVGADRRHRRAGLDRHPSAADPVAGNPQTAAFGPDPRRQRRNARHPRRHGRRGGAACGIAGLRPQRLHRHRGPPLLFALRHRSVGNSPRRRRRRAASRRFRRRLDHHAAARQESVPHAGAHRHPQAAGNRARALARTQIRKARDSRTLSQPRLFRLRRLWHRSRRATLFRQVGAAIDAARSGDAGRPRAIAVAAGAEPQSRRRGAPRRARDRRHGGIENDQRQRRKARIGASGARDQAGRRRLGQLRRRLGDGRGRRHHRQYRSGHRRGDHDRSGAAKRGRAGLGRHAQRRRATSSISAKARWSR